MTAVFPGCFTLTQCTSFGLPACKNPGCLTNESKVRVRVRVSGTERVAGMDD